MAADKAALGTMPMAPYQYCEPLRAASSRGWYAFPLADTLLKWDGHSVFHWDRSEECWEEVKDVYLPEEDADRWREHAGIIEPPPVLTSLFVPGIVQLWTGLLFTTEPGWSLHVRPLANLTCSRAYQLYEGIIESDGKPCPLFINMRLLQTDREIYLEQAKPLFQVQPLPNMSYDSKLIEIEDMRKEDWRGIETFLRLPGERPPGEYGKRVRRRAKQEERSQSGGA